jgi:hypothetical protein
MVDIKMERKDPEEGIRLKIKRSPISGSGIARVHSSVLKMADFEEGKVVEASLKNRKRVMRLVADEIMERGKISLRQKDIEKLGAAEGEEILLIPVKGMGERITKGFSFLKRKGDNR